VVDGARLLALRVRVSGTYRRRFVHGSPRPSSGFFPGRGEMLETVVRRQHSASRVLPAVCACSCASRSPLAVQCAVDTGRLGGRDGIPVPVSRREEHAHEPQQMMRDSEAGARKPAPSHTEYTRCAVSGYVGRWSLFVHRCRPALPRIWSAAREAGLQASPSTWYGGTRLTSVSSWFANVVRSYRTLDGRHNAGLHRARRHRRGGGTKGPVAGARAHLCRLAGD